MARVRWTQRARDDLQEVYDFIARDSFRSAELLVDRIISSTERLSPKWQSIARISYSPIQRNYRIQLSGDLSA